MSSRPGGPRDLACFAACAPGLEPLLAEEIGALGIAGTAEPGGVSWAGGYHQLAAANLRLRTASRVTVTAAEFRARTFFELERHARRIPWERWVAPGGRVRLRVTSRKSKLYHEGAVAQRLLEALARAVPGARAADDAADEEGEGADAQLFVVRFLHDRCVVRADASGALLHARGYRLALGRAPLRETLAAAMLLGSGWRGHAPLVDPLCGSGTIAIEAALLARGIAPGLAAADRAPRPFAFRAWPEADAAAWEAELARAHEAVRPSSPVPILASDRDAGAVEAARANAARAGVAEDVEVVRQAVSALEPPPGPGWVVSNPPYGVRVGEAAPLRDLYAALGRTLRQRCAGWTVALLSAEPRLEAQTGLELRPALRTRNGGIPVRLVVARVPVAD